MEGRGKPLNPKPQTEQKQEVAFERGTDELQSPPLSQCAKANQDQSKCFRQVHGLCWLSCFTTITIVAVVVVLLLLLIIVAVVGPL